MQPCIAALPTARLVPPELRDEQHEDGVNLQTAQQHAQRQNHLDNAGTWPKLSTGPTLPSPGPTLEMQVSVAVNALIRSMSCTVRTIVPTVVTMRYNRKSRPPPK